MRLARTPLDFLNRIWIVAFATGLLFAHHLQAETFGDLDLGLVGHWTFDDGKGTTAQDALERNHGRVMGDATWVSGRIGGALAFDGKDDYVSIPNEADFDITNNVTVAAWIKVTSFTKPWQGIVTKGDRAWRLHRANDRETVGFASSDLARKQVGDLLGKKRVGDGEWHHVAGLLNGNKMSIFVDGALDAWADSSPNISANNFPVLIGANAQISGRLFHGLIDDVRIYNRALSVAELRMLVRAAGAPAPSSSDSTLASVPAPIPASPPAPSLPAGTFQNLFDGKTLAGWNALDMGYWSVEDGAITGQSSEANPCTKNQFMVWQGGDVADFELTLKFRVRGNGCNSGVQFRSKMREDGLAIGYQADIYQSGGYLGGVCDELHRRDGPELLSANGSKTVIDKAGARTRTPIDTKATFKPWPAWNDYHILAKGNEMILRINGVTASVLVDEEEAHADLQGILGLQLRSGKPMTVQFRDIQLKQLEPGFVRLFDGQTLEGWHLMNDAKFVVEAGVLKHKGGLGWLRSEQQYSDFVLRHEFRFLEPKQDGGVFVRSSMAGDNWPTRKIEVQIENTERMAKIFGAEHELDVERTKKALNPTGEWNAYEIELVGSNIDVRLNGELVSRSDKIDKLSRGYIGLQGENGAHEYRNIRIKDLDK